MTELVDPSTGRILVEVDDELWELVPGFLESRQDEARAITDALVDGNYALIAALGHAMKGVGVSYGFTSITDIGDRLEMAARASDRDELTRAFSQLKSYLARVEPRRGPAT